MNRTGEAEKKYFRAERTVLINDCWYYLSRENAPKGPYVTRGEAEEAVERYTKLMSSQYFSDSELGRINALEM